MMKRLALALALLLATITLASAQCTGVFTNNTVCGNTTGANNTPRMTATSSLPLNLVIGGTTITGGTNPYLLFNNNGVLGNESFAALLSNPTAQVGLTAINGTALTAMRSDGAPALNQSISPTWLGTHTFNILPVLPTQTANTFWAGPVSGSAAIPTFRAIASGDIPAAALPAGVAANVLLTKTANYTIANTDCGKTIQAGTGSTGYFKITLPVVSGFDSTCKVTVTNGDTARAKALAGFPSDLPTLVSSSPAIYWLGPQQTVQVEIVNGAWATSYNPGKWAPTSTAQFYVNPSGGADDGTTDGLAVGSAFATPPHAYDAAYQNVNVASGSIVANVPAGTFTYTSSNAFSSGPITGCSGPNCFIFRGAGTASTILTSSTASTYIFYVLSGAQFSVDDMTVTSSGTGGFCVVVAAGYVNVSNVGHPIQFTNCTGGAIDTNSPSAQISHFGNITYTGTHAFFAIAEGGSHINMGGGTITVTGATCTTAYQADLTGSNIDFSPFPTFTGSTVAGCKKYNVSQNGWILTNGNSASLPGSVGGTISTGGGIDSLWSGASVAGSNTQVQFNNSGAFGASANFLWDGTGITVGASGTLGYIQFGNATSGLLKIQPTTGALSTNVLSLPNATDTLIAKATTDTLTNKTFDTAGTGNSFSINGVAATANTGTGSVVRATSPTIVSPTFTGTVAGAGTIPLSILATQAADTVVINATGGSASPTAAAVGSCSAASSALTYNTSTHAFGCNSISGTGTVTSITPGNGLTSTLTATAPGSAITSTGTLYGAALVNAQTGTSYAIADGDRAKLVTASNAAAQAYSIAQAGAASAFQAGWFADINNISTNVAGVVTITPTTSTINGASTFVLRPGQKARIVSDGTNYQIALTGTNLKAPVSQILLSGTAATYTVTSGATRIQCFLQGPGGSSSGSGTTPGTAAAGTDTTFSTATASAGAPGTNAGTQAAGGGFSGCDTNSGVTGQGGQGAGGGTNWPGFPGANSQYGGGGAATGIANGATVAGADAAANSGSGASSALGTGVFAASGGGAAGGFCPLTINAPSATYTYTVGLAGTKGSAGTLGAAGGTGGSGRITCTDYFNFLLKRDLAPAANDNTPMYLNMAA